MYNLPAILQIQLNRFKQVGRGVEKDCSYISFSEEIDVSEYVIGEEEMKTYGEEIRKEVKDIDTGVGVGIGMENKMSDDSEKSGGGYINNNNNKKNMTRELREIYKRSNGGIRYLRSNGRYFLYGVVVHSGSATGGHYYTFIRKEEERRGEEEEDGGESSSFSPSFLSENESLWWELNDEKVRTVKWEKFALIG
jgi:hypothetical protein